MHAALSSHARTEGLPFAKAGSLAFVVGMTALMFVVAAGDRLPLALGGIPYAGVATLGALGAGMMGGLTIGRGRTLPTSRSLLLLGGALVVVAALELVLYSAARTAPAPVAALLLLVPAIATGVIVAVLGRLTARDLEGTRRTTGLAALAFAGAAAGSAIAMWLLVPTLGPDGSVRAAALLSTFAGVLSELFAWRAPVDATAPISLRPPSRSRDPRPFAIGAAFVALLATSALVALVHLVSVVVGSAGLAFGTSLVTVSLGLALGIARARKLRAHHKEAAARALVASGFAIALTLPLWDRISWLFAISSSFLGSWREQTVVHTVGLAALVALPTSWMGTAILVLRPRFTTEVDVAGGARIIAASGFGAVVGAFGTGVLFVPTLGSQRVLGLVATGFALVAFTLAYRQRRHLLLTIVATLALVVFPPRWDERTMAFGLTPLSHEKLAWSQEDTQGGWSAIATGGALGTNGAMAVDPTHVLDGRRGAELGALVAPSYGRVLIRGLDLGLLDILVAYPWRAIELKGPSSALVAAARQHLSPRTRGALADPRVVRAPPSAEPYDLILEDAPRSCFDAAPGCARTWMSNVRDGLAEGGVLAIAVPLADARGSELDTLVRTARAHFPHVALAVYRTRAVVLAARGALRLPRARLSEPAARDDGTPAIEGVLALDASAETCVSALGASAPLTFAALHTCSSAEAAAALLSP